MVLSIIQLLICWALSYIVEMVGLASQGVAFIWLSIGNITLSCIRMSNTDSVKAFVTWVVTVLVDLGVTWIASKMFAIDFTVAYQIIMLGRSLG